MKLQPRNPEFRNNPEYFYQCYYILSPASHAPSVFCYIHRGSNISMHVRFYLTYDLKSNFSVKMSKFCRIYVTLWLS